MALNRYNLPQDLKVKVGLINLETEQAWNIYSVSSISRHRPKGRIQGRIQQIAVLTLENEVDFFKFNEELNFPVVPACLPKSFGDKMLGKNALRTSGWGYSSDEGRRRTELHVAKMAVKTITKKQSKRNFCSLHGSKFHTFAEFAICTERVLTWEGGNPCTEDEGAPLISIRKGVSSVVGVFAGMDHGCNNDRDWVFVKLTRDLTQWIKDQL